MGGGRRLLGRAGALVLASAVTLTGCGAAGVGGAGGGTTASPDDVPTVAPDGLVCLDRSPVEPATANSPEALARPRLGPDRPTRFVVCSVRTVRVPGKGEWTVRVEQVATAGVDALATALRLPDEDPTGGPCLAYADGVPELWAVDGTRRAVLVRFPIDECRHLRAEVKGALDAVSWRETGSRRLEQVTPQQAIDSGCPTAWKDMVAIEAARRGMAQKTATAGSVGGLDTSSQGSVCVFRITDRSETPTGTFERGGRLRGARWAALVADLRRTPPVSGSCSGLGDRFAVVLGEESEAIYVELDGCSRILTPDGGFRQATPAVLADLRTASARTAVRG